MNLLAASKVHGILAPSNTPIHPLSISFLASSISNSNCVAHGNATSHLIFHISLLWGRTSTLLSTSVAYSLIRPLLSSLSALKISKLIPSGTYIVLEESFIAMTLPPNSVTFFKQYKATLPLPEMITFLPFKSVALYCFKASNAK